MMFVLVLTFVVVLVAWLGRRTVSPRRPLGKGRAPLRCLVILGSGGHTSEMFMALSGLSWEHYAPHYVIATTDKGSEAAMRTFEALHHPGAPPTVSFVPRAREVGQSYATSVFTTLNALMYSIVLVLRVRPHLVLTNGPGTAVPICVVAFLLRVVGVPCALVYMESFTCVEHLSVSGRILYPLADLVTVQWPQLRSHYPRALCVAPDLTALAPLPERKSNPDSYALVTVGSTSFDALIRACDQPWFVDCIHKKFGIPNIRMQIGNGAYVPSHPDIEHLRFKREGFAKDLAKASMVIGHAGAGSILDAMRGLTPMVVVPNEALMNNHQTQLCDALTKAKLVHAVVVSDMPAKFPNLLPSGLRMYPTEATTVLKNALEC